LTKADSRLSNLGTSGDYSLEVEGTISEDLFYEKVGQAFPNTGTDYLKLSSSILHSYRSADSAIIIIRAYLEQIPLGYKSYLLKSHEVLFSSIFIYQQIGSEICGYLL
jgi:hypothetical protein